MQKYTFKIIDGIYLAKSKDDDRQFPNWFRNPDTICDDYTIWIMPDGTETIYQFFGTGYTMLQAINDLIKIQKSN